VSLLSAYEVGVVVGVGVDVVGDELVEVVELDGGTDGVS
jgi:hypothetical protein